MAKLPCCEGELCIDGIRISCTALTPWGWEGRAIRKSAIVNPYLSADRVNLYSMFKLKLIRVAAVADKVAWPWLLQPPDGD